MDLREELAEGLKDVPDDASNLTAMTEAPVTSAEPSASTEKPAAATAEVPAATDKPEAQDGRTRNADGTFAPKPAEQPATSKTDAPATDPKATPVTTEVPVAPVVDLAPSTWTAAAKAEWSKLPEVVRSEMKKREGDYQKGIGQYKTAAEQGSRLMAEIQPYMQIIAQEGGTPERAVKSMMHTAYLLRTGTPQQKAALVMQIAQTYGADMSGYTVNAGGATTEQPQGAPQGIDQRAIAEIVQNALQPHMQKIEQVSSRFATAEQQSEQATQQQVNGQIEAFRTAADEKGQPKHPYFENVRELMGALISNGNAPDLDTAYVMACRADPEVSKVLDAAQRHTDDAQRLAEQKRLADDARRANTVNAQGQGSVGVIDTSKLSLRDELASHMGGGAI